MKLKTSLSIVNPPEQPSGELTILAAYEQKMQPTPLNEIDLAIDILLAHKDEWASLTIRHKLAFLDQLKSTFTKLNHDWVDLNLLAKDSRDDPYAAGLEWACGPVAITHYLNELQSALTSIAKNGVPFLPGKVSVNQTGQVVAQIHPRNLYERVTTSGLTAEVWMQKSVSLAELPHTQALAYQGSDHTGKVVLVLGAGNVSGIPVNDSLSKLFVENKLVVLKMHPANDYLGPLIEEGFSSLIEAGFVRVIYGGVQEGAYLTHHSGVDEIHLTGSDKTYEAIVFGAGDDGAAPKQTRQPLLTKRFTSELGNICPAIIVPGPWSESDILYQAEQIASNLCDNAGYSCSRARMIIQHSGWAQRENLLQAVRSVLAKTPPRAPYYPGGRDLYKRFTTAHPEAEQFGSTRNGRLPWTLIANLDAQSQDEICFTTESFCPVIAETGLQAETTAGFIDRAVEFANEQLWGSLTSAIIVHPKSLQDPAVREALERAVADLRYGIVTINSLTSLGWLLNSIPWGSFPGNQPWDIQSGTAFVHNAYMFSKPEKTILRGPFRTWPRPIWFPSRARAIEEVARKMASYENEPSIKNLLGILWGAVRY